MERFTFTKAQAAAVLGAASKDSTRYNLCAIRLEPGALVATDGHQLHRVVTDPVLNESSEHRDCSRTTADGYQRQTTVHIARGDFDRIVKAMSKSETCVVCYVEPDDAPGGWRAELSSGAVFEFKPIDLSEWVDYRRVIPSDREHRSTVTLDARKLKAICDAAIKASERPASRQVPVTVQLGDDGFAPVRFEHAASGFDAVLMGLRP